MPENRLDIRGCPVCEKQTPIDSMARFERSIVQHSLTGDISRKVERWERLLCGRCGETFAVLDRTFYRTELPNGDLEFVGDSQPEEVPDVPN